MSSANDAKILTLRKKIQEKKSNVVKIKFVPVTNCSIELDGVRHNISVLNQHQLMLLLIKLNSYKLSITDLEVSNVDRPYGQLLKNISISGYTIQEWITDIKLKLDVLLQNVVENDLKELEKKLNTLLSEDKKTELELANIANLLKD